jgi:hypothetical protein
MFAEIDFCPGACADVISLDPDSAYEVRTDPLPLRQIPFAIAGPYDGVVRIFSSLSKEALEVPVEHLDLLIAVLSTLDRRPKSRES